MNCATSLRPSPCPSVMIRSGARPGSVLVQATGCGQLSTIRAVRPTSASSAAPAIAQRAAPPLVTRRTPKRSTRLAAPAAAKSASSGTRGSR
ncbi:MAG: hypothetical protein IPG96_12370 [Proteobacteria bacterium]|nr:hypothetical protein [Pseudomonadota bacterium]